MTVWFLLITAPTFLILFGKMGFIAIVTVNIIISFFDGEMMMMMMMTFAGDDIVSYFLVFVMRVVCFRIRLWFFTFVLSLISQFSITVLSFLFKAIWTRDMLLFIRILRVLLPRLFTLFLFRYIFVRDIIWHHYVEISISYIIQVKGQIVLRVFFFVVATTSFNWKLNTITTVHITEMSQEFALVIQHLLVTALF